MFINLCHRLAEVYMYTPFIYQDIVHFKIGFLTVFFLQGTQNNLLITNIKSIKPQHDSIELTLLTSEVSDKIKSCPTARGS